MEQARASPPSEGKRGWQHEANRANGHLWSHGRTFAGGLMPRQRDTRIVMFHGFAWRAALGNHLAIGLRFCRCVSARGIIAPAIFFEAAARDCRRSILSTHEFAQKGSLTSAWPPARMMPRARSCAEPCGRYVHCLSRILPGVWRRRWAVEFAEPAGFQHQADSCQGRQIAAPDRSSRN